MQAEISLPSRQKLLYLRDLLREMVRREMKLRYKRSILGIAWSLINPLAQLLVFTFLFRRVVQLNIPNYPVFVFTGVLVWSWFQTALMGSAGAITDNRELIKRPGFPAGILPVITVTSNLVNFLFALPLLLLFVAFGGGRLSAMVFLLPFLIVLQFLLILGLGYLAATFQVTFRDTQHLLGVFLLLLFYLTPVFYNTSLVPERFKVIYLLNPMVHLIGAYRDILLQGVLPDFKALGLVTLIIIALLGFGYTIFKRASYSFVEEL